MKLLSKIETKYGFALPPIYREIAASGLLDDEFHLPDGYLMSLEEIAGFDWGDYLPAIDGLVPFARNGAGEHYCWFVPRPTTDGETAVVLAMPGCKAPLFSPSFSGMLFRDALNWYSMIANDDEDYVGLPAVTKLIERQGPVGWCDILRSLKDLPTKFDKYGQECLYTEKDMDVLIGDLFGSGYVSEELDWQILD